MWYSLKQCVSYYHTLELSRRRSLKTSNGIQPNNRQNTIEFNCVPKKSGLDKCCVYLYVCPRTEQNL